MRKLTLFILKLNPLVHLTSVYTIVLRAHFLSDLYNPGELGNTVIFRILHHPAPHTSIAKVSVHCQS